jgi:hypothetical protein
MAMRISGKQAGVCAALVMLISSAAPAAAAPSIDEQTVLARIPATFFARMAHFAPIAADGATGENVEGYKVVEVQGFTADYTALGLATEDAAPIDGAFQIAGYAFAHQNADGSFQRGGPSSAASFVADFGHSLRLLDTNAWFQRDVSTQSLVSQLPALRQDEGAALAYLMAHRAALERDDTAANRLLRYADAYYFAGVAVHDRTARNAGIGFLRSFLDAQTSDGTFPELGGFDSSYQCLSLYLGEVLFLNLPQSHPMRDRLWTAIVRGMERERLALAPSGTIATFHNTRTGPDSLWAIRTGDVHQFDGGHAALAFQYYAAITGGRQARQDARAVSLRYWPNSVP